MKLYQERMVGSTELMKLRPSMDALQRLGKELDSQKNIGGKGVCFFFKQMTSQIGRKTMILFFCILFFGDDEE